VLPVAVLLAFALGCGKSPPTLAGGKPVSHWVEVLHSSPDAGQRKEAAFKLGNVGPTDPTALPAVAAALKDRDPAVRREAIAALVKFGTAAQECVPALSELRDHDTDPKVRAYAAKALETLQRGR
jgi:HEAT repeat protein